MASTATKTAPAAKAPKQIKLCLCDCGTQIASNSTFAQGHDARYVSNLVADAVEHKYDAATVANVERDIAAATSSALSSKYLAAANRALAPKPAKAPRKAAAPKAAKAAKGTVKARVGRWVYEGQVKDGVFHYSTKSGAPAQALSFELVK